MMVVRWKIIVELNIFFIRSKEMLNICTFHRNDQRFVPLWFGSWISERFSSIWFHSKMRNYILTKTKRDRKREKRNNQIKWVHRWYKNKNLKIDSKSTSYTKVCMKKRKAERMPFKWNALNDQLEWWPKMHLIFDQCLHLIRVHLFFQYQLKRMTNLRREENKKTNGQRTTN